MRADRDGEHPCIGAAQEITYRPVMNDAEAVEERNLAAARSQTKLKSVSGSAEGSSTKIDQLISDINLVSIDNISTLDLDSFSVKC